MNEVIQEMLESRQEQFDIAIQELNNCEEQLLNVETNITTTDTTLFELSKRIDSLMDFYFTRIKPTNDDSVPIFFNFKNFNARRNFTHFIMSQDVINLLQKIKT